MEATVSRRAVLLAIAGVAAGTSMAAPARACSFLGPTPYQIDASMQATDQVAPTLQPLSVTRLQRGMKTEGCMSGSSCDGSGSLAIGGAATDDVTPANGIGYRFTLEAGALPPSFSILLNQPSQAVVSDGEIWFTWNDGTDDHDPIDFTLRVVAIDRAGNESAPQTVRVTDDPGGCAIARPRAPSRGLAFVAAAALLLAARRRPSRRLG
jgi:hypothetical protein